MASVDVATKNIDEIFALFTEQGGSDYVGEKVSQLAHALQCGSHAAASGASDSVIAGCLLHDVGHMLGLRSPASHEWMGECGVMRHESLGSEWLSSLGLPREATELVRRHVDAKRYLCWKNPAYLGRLSEASTVTLGYQGGPMGEEEARAFELDPLHSTILKMRHWDESAKDPLAEVPDLESYRPLLMRLIAPAQ
jgi:phosphonate degradation associated HDIG domain protein